VIRHPIFVVGMPRSGTTLLSSMLDAHPDIAITPETHFYTHCHSSRENKNGHIVAWTCLQQQPGFQDIAFDREERRCIRMRAQSENGATPSALLRAVGRTYADRYEAEAWGEKTPDHLVHVPDIMGDFPDAVILTIVRDPRDVCLSLQGLPWNRDSLPESAWKWRRYAWLTERFRVEYPNRFKEIRYEDLLDAPKETMENVLSWINASFDRSVLSFHENEERRINIDREPWKENTYRPVDPENKGKWQEQMGPAEQWLIQYLTGRMLRRKGYSDPPVSFDKSFLCDFIRLVARSVWAVGARILRRWKMPPRSPRDHRPVWIRRRDE
jgi:hypothetical protein